MISRLKLDIRKPLKTILVKHVFVHDNGKIEALGTITDLSEANEIRKIKTELKAAKQILSKAKKEWNQ